MIAQTFRGPHSLYRRYQGLLESSLTALAFAVVVTYTLDSLAVFPTNWVMVAGIAMALTGVRWPIVAYILATASLLYPIYTINFYLAVLFVAISALGHRLFIHYLGATTLVLATPLLALYHLHWLIPVLAGLWWGGRIGAWAGALAAVWGKIIGGMSGLNIDWLVMAGQAPEAQIITERFQTANSLETLLLLVEPFSATSSIILYNLLQIIGWAIAGGFVGSLAGRRWVKYHAPWSILVITAGGGLIMLTTHVGLPYWLTEAVTDQSALVSNNPTAPLFSLIIVILVGTTIYTLRESLDLPVAPKRKPRTLKRVKQRSTPNIFSILTKGKAIKKQPVKINANLEKQPVTDMSVQSRGPVRVPHHSELPEWEPPKDDSGLIMLEID